MEHKSSGDESWRVEAYICVRGIRRKKPDSAELSGFVSLAVGSVPWFWLRCHFRAHCCSVLSLAPIKGCNSMKWDVMGDMYRYRNDTSKLKRVRFLKGLSCVCVCNTVNLAPQTTARLM